MKKKTLLLFLLFSSLIFSQIRNYDTYSFHKHNYSIDAGYGFTGFQNTRDNDNIRSIGHFDLGLKWMGGKVWGAKISFANDKTRVLRNELETGCDYQRFSVELVNNLTNLISEVQNRNRKFNLILHGGAGYAYQTSTVLSGTDELGSIICGINPQYSITNRLALGIDLTGITNFSRHFDYNGQRVVNGTGISETGFIYNACFTISYTYSRSDSEQSNNKINETEVEDLEKIELQEKQKSTEITKKDDNSSDNKEARKLEKKLKKIEIEDKKIKEKLKSKNIKKEIAR